MARRSPAEGPRAVTMAHLLQVSTLQVSTLQVSTLQVSTLQVSTLQVSTPGCSGAIQRGRSRSSPPFAKNRMFDPEQVSSLIGDIYDAVVDQTLRIRAL